MSDGDAICEMGIDLTSLSLYYTIRIQHKYLCTQNISPHHLNQDPMNAVIKVKLMYNLKIKGHKPYITSR